MLNMTQDYGGNENQKNETEGKLSTIKWHGLTLIQL